MSHYTSIISFKTRALSSVVVHTSFTLLAIITLPSRYTHLLSTLSKSLHFEAERVWTWFIDSELLIQKIHATYLVIQVVLQVVHMYSEMALKSSPGYTCTY
jgi:hypothetical protein